MESIATGNGLGRGHSELGVNDANYGIVVFSHLRWNFVWQRPQQFLSRFASNRRILFVEEPIYDLEPGADPRVAVEQAEANVYVASPHFPTDRQDETQNYLDLRKLTKQAIAEVDTGDFDCPLLWYYSPMMAAWSLEYFRCRGIVYDCMDELSQFKGASPNLIKNEQRLLDAADIVFTGGFELWLKKQKHHENVHFFGCGVEYDHFARAQEDETEIPADVRDLPKPVLGWFGVIDERVDYDLIRHLSASRPDWSLVFVGPVVKVDPASLPQAPNIHWIGQRDYKELPNYCKRFDICMMCFALNEATEFINPTKALEYLATGRPVVSTAVRDVVRQYDDVVYVASSAEEFVRIVGQVLAEGDTKMVRKGIERAKSSGWENTVSKMESLIAEAIEEKETLAV